MPANDESPDQLAYDELMRVTREALERRDLSPKFRERLLRVHRIAAVWAGASTLRKVGGPR